ncbi:MULTISPECIES: hypothetical protein [Bacillus]|uniref:hypothetical protein n=1 Tax=Bacillus TaxID=1386 RepID=UPI00081521FB|nr:MULTISPECIES: hypothetical protein [Bacillus]MDU0071984.1 hypothetical protein [Bacillus sp. IG6]MED8019564.1 hypothetical protein [Bacillus glycinifermentans]WKB78970.1 hypothetical protein QYM22_09085 [Bacillus glycinifermentans]SCA85535.1 putative secreted protein [Bacillus glycinifermentans]
MKKRCLIACVCLLLAGCTTYKPKPKGITQEDALKAFDVSKTIDILKNAVL